MNVVLTTEESRQLVGACSGPFAQRDRALIVFVLHTGFRVSELAGLSVHPRCQPGPAPPNAPPACRPGQGRPRPAHPRTAKMRQNFITTL